MLHCCIEILHFDNLLISDKNSDPISPEVLFVYSSLLQDCQELVVLIGMPASGKSTFFKRFFEAHGYVHVNRDTLGSEAKCVSAATQALESKKSVVVDNTNPTVQSRLQYIQIAESYCEYKNAGTGFINLARNEIVWWVRNISTKISTRVNRYEESSMQVNALCNTVVSKEYMGLFQYLSPSLLRKNIYIFSPPIQTIELTFCVLRNFTGSGEANSLGEGNTAKKIRIYCIVVIDENIFYIFRFFEQFLKTVGCNILSKEN